MKLSHQLTYHCDVCNRYAYPQDITLDSPDDRPLFSTRKDGIVIWVLYECACGTRSRAVRHVVDENNELFPHYHISLGDGA